MTKFIDENGRKWVGIEEIYLNWTQEPEIYNNPMNFEFSPQVAKLQMQDFPNTKEVWFCRTLWEE